MISSTKKLKASRYKELFLLLFLSVLSAWPAIQQNDTVRLLDNSDWWSENRTSEPDEIEPQERGFAKSAFQVLGINLDEKMFSHASSKLGKAPLIERGDASTGRLQACYVSSGATKKVHLIFEQSEVGFSFYMFVDGLLWEGSDRCVPSEKVSPALATASGLHLGQTPAHVIAILGKPTKRSENELLYSFLVRKKTSAQDLKEARERNPDMNDRDFQENFGYYNLGARVTAKFVNSRLAYLAVSKVESN
ncbi:MAG TPA: hypothetical protein VEU98_04665 [Candidatus Eremiobacteraceae bacterium]|nr:hypothetical protein [Candidatus Eremiobacteraceae bacterium]